MFATVVSSTLKWTAVVFMVLSFMGISDNTIRRRKKTASITLLDASYGICNLITSSVCAWQAVNIFEQRRMESMPSGLIFAPHFLPLCVLPFLMISVAITSVYARWRHNGCPFLICGAHCIHCVALIMDLYSVTGEWGFFLQHSLSLAGNYTWLLTSNVCLIFATFGSILYSGLQYTAVTKNKKQIAKSDKNDHMHSVLGRIACKAGTRHAWNVVYHSKANRKDLPILVEELQCRRMMEALYRLLKTKPSRTLGPRRFSVCFLRVIWSDVVGSVVSNFTYYANLIIRVPLMWKLLQAKTTTEASMLTVLFVASCTFEYFLGCIEAIYFCILGPRVKSLAIGAIFNKMMRMSPSALSKYPAGFIVSTVAVDCSILSVASATFLRMAVGVLCMPFVFYAISTHVGALTTLCCAACQLVPFLLLIPSVKLQTNIWAKIVQLRDERLKRMSGLLTSVKLVKLYAWEETFANFIAECRRREVNQQFVANLADGFMDTLLASSSSMMTMVLFGSQAFFYPENTLTASLTFSCIYALSLADPTTTSVILYVRGVILAAFGVKRIARVCTEPEKNLDKKIASDQDQLENGSVVMEGCTFAWSSPEAAETECTDILRDVTLSAKPGSLIGVTGFVGSGKTAFLAAIRGEMTSLCGLCRTKGTLACVPQTACIYNMSIRDNILFGKPLDHHRYSWVLDACKLLSDVACFPAGDLTEVGERGTTLSGGQKQRISLARAAYSDSSIYLLDDTLSALDINVASEVFERVIGEKGILKGKTRFVVCNQGKYLKKMDRVLLVAGKLVASFDSFKELLKHPLCPKSIDADVKEEETDRISRRSRRNSSLNHANHEGEGKVTEDEVEMSQLTSLDLFLSMVRICGPWLITAFGFFVLRALALGMYLVWIRKWTEESMAGDYTHSRFPGLAALCLADVLFGWLGSLVLAVAFRNLSSRLHSSMVRCVLLSPVSFFDCTPRGRILNRFSTELDCIDSRFFLGTKLAMQTLTAGMARVVVTGLQYPTAGLLGGSTIIVFLLLIPFLVKSANAARRMETVDCSRLLQHVAETRDSLSVVCSYHAEDRFVRHCYRLVDAATRGLLGFLSTFRFIRFLGGLCGLLVVISSLAFAMFASISNKDILDTSSSIGLALSSSMAIPLLLVGGTGGILLFFQTFVSVERCLEYTRLPPEADTTGPAPHAVTKDSPPCDPSASTRAAGVPAHWPAEGKLEFDHYSASYRPGVLPNALNNVSFVVNPCEKASIVGRTGSGKSSLVLAVLRALKASKGRISIDGVDIALVPLKKLRSVITLIPQDPCLMGGSLRDVLDPTRQHSDQELWQALDEAHLKEFVKANPDKLLLTVEDSGSNLSIGQQQLVSLARALLRSPRVLLLDEATSHMDGDTDMLIQATLRKSFARCTVLTIAHRLHTVLDYDKILVMAGGQVAEFGPTNKLASNPRSIFSAMLQRAGLEQKRAPQHTRRNSSFGTRL
ncbi:ATP-binding cassette sub-family C member 4-like isoform X3 [Haemaphysalis longicornis]